MIALIMSRGAGIHSGNKLKAGRIAYLGPRTGDIDLPGFNRLAQSIKHAAFKLWQLIEKEDAIMRQRDLSRPRD
ncbi:hypothetical protein D3C87_1961500 [compost metagenome]